MTTTNSTECNYQQETSLEHTQEQPASVHSPITNTIGQRTLSGLTAVVRYSIPDRLPPVSLEATVLTAAVTAGCHLHNKLNSCYQHECTVVLLLLTA
jgi:hypothetical protein